MKIRGWLTLLAIAVLAYAFYLSYFKMGMGSGLPVGTPAPEFNLPSRAGPVSLSQYRGHPVLINFWATWCPPCRSEMPSLERLKKELEGHEVRVLAVSVDEEGWKAIDRFLRVIPLTMTVLWDGRGDVSEQYGVRGLPETYLVDKQGVLVKKYLGPRDWMEKGTVDEILEATKN